MILHLNGRFFGQAVTGVQRYGRELLAAVDARAARGDLPRPFTRAVVHVPTHDRTATPACLALEVRASGPGRGHAWEQLVLPRAVREGGVLFCLGNAAPIPSLLGRTPVVVTIHSVSWRFAPEAYSPAYRAWYRVLTPLIARYAARIITVSRSERETIARLYPRAASRLVAIQNGGPAVPGPDSRTALPPAPVPEPYVLYVGSLAQLKNLAGAIAAFGVLAASHPTLRLVVAGARSPALSAAEINLPPAIADRIVFLGQVEDPAFLAAAYRSARCLVFPSFYEASPLPPLEAMVEGCPVVASDLPALRERCGEAALYCDPHDAASIARSVTRVLDAPGLAESLRRRGTAQAGAFSWAACADATLAVLAEAACA